MVQYNICKKKYNTTEIRERLFLECNNYHNESINDNYEMWKKHLIRQVKSQ